MDDAVRSVDLRSKVLSGTLSGNGIVSLLAQAHAQQEYEAKLAVAHSIDADQQQLAAPSTEWSDLLDKFFPLFHGLIQYATQPQLAKTPILRSWANNQSASAWISSEFTRVAPGMGAIFFQTLAITGDTNLYLPINIYAVELSQLVSSKSTYMDKTAAANLTSIMCQDVFSQTSSFHNFATAPPVPFAESYTACRNSLSYAMTSSFGSAFAASSAYATAIWAVFGTLFVLFLRQYSTTVIVTETKEKVIEMILTDMKDESLRETIEMLHDRLEKIEQSSSSSSSSTSLARPHPHEQSSLSAKIIANFLRLHSHDLASLYHEGAPPSETMDAYKTMGIELSRRLALIDGTQSEYQESKRVESTKLRLSERMQSAAQGARVETPEAGVELSAPSHVSGRYHENPLHSSSRSLKQLVPPRVAAQDSIPPPHSESKADQPSL